MCFFNVCLWMFVGKWTVQVCPGTRCTSGSLPVFPVLSGLLPKLNCLAEAVKPCKSGEPFARSSSFDPMAPLCHRLPKITK